MRIIKEFVLREIAGTCVLVPTGATTQEFNGMITINDTAKFFWQNIEKVNSFEELIEKLLEEYDVPREIAERDMVATINVLMEKGIVDFTNEKENW